MKGCECEHEAHADDATKLTPNGNFGHYYGVEFAEGYLEEVKTIYGTFTICKDCANDCLPPDSPYRKGE